MALETLDMKEVREELRRALEVEQPLLDALRAQVRAFGIQEIGYRRCYAISPVATDGGENRLTFDPLNLEIIRVVDSDGRERFQKILPLSGGTEIFRAAFDSKQPKHSPVLARFLERLDIEYGDLSYFLDPARAQGDLRAAVRPFRDIVEWAVLLDIAWDPGQTTALVIRDGLLRTKALRKETIGKLAKSFQDAYKDKGSLLAGVAKRSKVLNYLSLGLALEETFRRKYPCFCEVPREIERQAHPQWRTWLEESTFGILHLAKLVEEPGGLVLPIDIPEWLMSRRKEILEYLAETAKSSFPVVGYPEPLIKAHEGAVLHGFEMSILEDLLVEEVVRSQVPNDADRTLEHVAIGRGLLRGGWKEYG